MARQRLRHLPADRRDQPDRLCEHPRLQPARGKFTDLECHHRQRSGAAIIVAEQAGQLTPAGGSSTVTTATSSSTTSTVGSSGSTTTTTSSVVVTTTSTTSSSSSSSSTAITNVYYILVAALVIAAVVAVPDATRRRHRDPWVLPSHDLFCKRLLDLNLRWLGGVLGVALVRLAVTFFISNPDNVRPRAAPAVQPDLGAGFRRGADILGSGPGRASSITTASCRADRCICSSSTSCGRSFTETWDTPYRRTSR